MMQYGLPNKYADELPFIRQVMFDAADDGPRMIYADWLDERNDARGEFLRIDLQLASLGQANAKQNGRLDRLRQERMRLIRQLDPQWISLLAKTPIELCPQKVEFKFMCPQRWENLRPFGDDQSVRYCDQCGRSVTYCFTIGQAREMAMQGQCVAIDPGVQRVAGDVKRVEPGRGESLRDYEFLGTIAVDF